jgi:hypothetical protein
MGTGLDLTKAEAADLASYLYRELCALIAAVHVLGREGVAELEDRLDRLPASLEAGWSSTSGTYHHLDRDLHICPGGSQLAQGQGEFEATIGRTFDPPARLLVRSYGVEGEPHDLAVGSMAGRPWQGEVERLGERLPVVWNRGPRQPEAYSRIDRIR